MSTKEALTRRYVEVVEDILGWEVEVLDDCSLQFRVNDLHFHLANYAPNDPEFLLVAMAVGMPDWDDSMRTSMALEVSKGFKAVKAVPTECGMLCTVECFVAAPHCLPSPSVLASVLPRIVRSLLDAADRLYEAAQLAGIEAASSQSSGFTPGDGEIA